jgi:hypothetical protein
VVLVGVTWKSQFLYEIKSCMQKTYRASSRPS